MAVFLAASACSGRDARFVDANGTRVPNGRVEVDGAVPLTVDLSPGPSHCDWESVQFLSVLWPLGGVVTGYYSDAIRQYVWDPTGSHGFDLAGLPQRDATPPPDAAFTGYRHGRVELWFADSDANSFAYMRQADGSFERWPRSMRLNGCA